MPMPGGSDLHINQALTNVSVKYVQDADEYIAPVMFPAVPVQKRSDVYHKYSKADWRRSDAQKRPPGTESAGTGWLTNTDQYYCDVYALHTDIDDQTRANADSEWQLDKDGTEFITGQLMLQRDIIWANTYFKTGVWGTEWDGVAASPGTNQFLQWDLSSSDPLKTKSALANAFKLSTGKLPNRMAVGADVWEALENHPAILDRIKYTQEGVVTEQLVARYFGVKFFKVCYASEAVGAAFDDAKQQDAAATYSYIADPKGVLLAYAPDSPSLNTPSAGYTFNWKGYVGGNKQGLAVGQFRMQHLKSDRIEAEAAYTMKLVSADCGIWLNGAVS